jgi:Leucine-rich repeat (LRR) protein/GTPase SAR1 family protein
MMESQNLLDLLQRIDRAAEEQSKELDLVGMNLTELPPEIGKLTQLESLRLGYWTDDGEPVGNSLTDLPAELANLSNLTSLSLGNNQLTKIPAVIAQLTNLKILGLGSNQITDIFAEISNLTNLTDLYLQDNQIAKLPQTIGNLTKLTTLHLNSNQISELPATIGNLINLTSLDLQDNQISELPATIGNLTNLTSLDLQDNQISELPAIIGNLINLTSLDLQDNQIGELPATIGNLTNLTILHLWRNQISRLPQTIGNLTSLTILHLAGNQIAELPQTIGNLTSLTTLDLQHNQIAELPATIGNLTNLITLTLRSNKIAELPATIGNLTSLTSLDLWVNKITVLPQTIGNLTNLTTLDFHDNKITVLPQAIGNLTNLTTLDIGVNQISELPATIGNLTSLTSLALRRNQTSELPATIGNLTSLTTLDLTSNQISELPATIGNLTSLTILHLADNQIAKLPATIGNLTSLTTLDLQHNRIGELPATIGNLTSLTTLDLTSNQISELPATIGNLTSLTSLALRINQITELPETIGNLVSLTFLYLWSNQISKLPATIGNLISLNFLDIERNQISELPQTIGNLTSLRSLDLNRNQISELPATIGNLTSLRSFDLNRNKITELPQTIGNLTSLIDLTLWGNQISELPPTIGNLTSLTTLELQDNQISELPATIGNLTSLTTLELTSNQIAELPATIGNLTSLTSLKLYNNQITIIPEWFRSFENLEKLDLRGNPVPIPPEILGINKGSDEDPGDLQAILSFYFQTQDPKASEPLYEAKFIIVGEGDAGKTTLAKKLTDPDYALKSDEKSTQGIDVIRWDFTQPNGKRFRVNIWDFGGQDIYHATHQFFLTARSLYTLLVDNRRQNPNFYYWLNVVRFHSDDSPIFIVKNKKGDRNFELNERQLRSEFLQLKESLPTDLSTNSGLNEIQHFIQTHIANLPHIAIPIPKTWVKIRNVLENYAQHKNYISIEAYHALGKRNGVKDPQERLRISQYLHDLGICLHFQKDSTLKHRVILKPSWATNAVYKVTDAPTVIQNKGRFTTTDLQTIWGDSKYADMQDELVKLMQNFKICYPLGKDTYIAPILLPSDEPVYTWEETNNLTLRYEYTFMPKGIVTRFIIEMHDKIESAPDNSQLVWKNGVILTNGSARVEVIEDYEKKHIRLRAVGFDKKSFLAIVRHEFQKIHGSYERLGYKELIPCNCSECQSAPEPYTYSLEDPEKLPKKGNYSLEYLEKCLKKGKSKVDCTESLLEVDVRKLIDETIEPIEPTKSTPPLVLMNLRQLVEKALTDDELLNLCYDFEVAVTQGQTKDQRIRALVEYIERKGEQSKLLTEIEQLNSNVYKEYLAGKPESRRSTEETSRSTEAPTPGSSGQNNITIHINNEVRTMNEDNVKNTYVKGDNIAGDKVMGDKIGGDKVGRDKIGTQINNSQNLAQAAAEIKQLLDQLSEEYNPNTPTGQDKISKEAIVAIDKNPTLKARITKALKEGGAAALTEAIHHPAVTVFIAACKGFAEGK